MILLLRIDKPISRRQAGNMIQKTFGLGVQAAVSTLGNEYGPL